MKKMIVVLLTITLFVSCSTSDIKYDSHNLLNNSKLLNIADVRGNFEFIALDDSSDEALVPDVWNVKFSDEYIFILSAQSGVFQFSRNGEFVRKISQKGKGAGEWSVIIDIDIDDINNKIYIYDYAGKVMSFSFENGEYINQTKFPGKMFSKIFIMNNHLLVAPYNSMGKAENIIHCLNLENSTVKSTGHLQKFTLLDYNNILYSFTKGVIANDGSLLVHPNLSNTIYEYFPESNLLTEKITFSFKDPLTPNLMGKGFDGLSESQTIMDIAKNQQYFFVKVCSYNTKGEWFAFDRIDKETYKLSLRYDGNMKLEFSPKYQSTGFVADLINPNLLEENSPELQYLSKKSGKNITPDSNPVIVLWE